MKKKLRLLLNGCGIVALVFAAFMFGKSNLADERKVYIASERARQTIVSLIGEEVPDELPTVKQMESIDETYLTIHGSSLEGVEHLTKLEAINYYPDESGALIDLRPLGKMKNLKSIDNYSHRTDDKATEMVQDISFLANLDKLEVLRLNHFPVLDLTPLSNLKKLKLVQLNSMITAPTAVVEKESKKIMFGHPVKYSSQFNNAVKKTYVSGAEKVEIENDIITIHNIMDKEEVITVSISAISKTEDGNYYNYNLNYVIPLIWK
ncbi:hypothetical protein ACWOC1_07215 [Enterococcus quebecensis]|uniref:Uncharacterized protein n=1 Tax=Enterococcus quebecensis TaxID=903983 RepID=A0A1E5H3N9_9ENTE|nr:hypothetical protein [Enterococcus quebecensis]OEG19617.1 hypothetical protein BCR23_02700 [Enterococcus quebecensis]